MKEEDKLKQRYGTDTGFRVPDGYFDSVFAKIGSELPEYPEVKTVKSLSRWQRLKPYVYLAAMFGGIWCTMKMVTMITDSQPNQVSLDNPPELVAKAMESPEVLSQVCSTPSAMIVEESGYEDAFVEEEAAAPDSEEAEAVADEVSEEAASEETYSEFIDIEDIDLKQLQAALYAEESEEDYYYYI